MGEVDLAGGHEGVDAALLGRFNRLTGPLNIPCLGARQRADHGVLDALGNRMNRIKIPLRGHGKAGLDHVDTHGIQLIGHQELFIQVHRHARRLLAIAEGGVENDDVVFHSCK